MTNAEVLNEFFDKVIDSIVTDAASKNQKIPITSLRYETSEAGGTLFGAHYFKYLIRGRRPGKQPPPDVMTKYVQDNPDKLAQARAVFKNITEQQLGFLIGRKIAQKGTDIYEGKKPGLDLAGAIKDNMPDLLSMLAQNEVTKIRTNLNEVLK